jgi:hypothetical protein
MSNIPEMLRQTLRLAANHGKEVEKKLARRYTREIEGVISRLEGDDAEGVSFATAGQSGLPSWNTVNPPKDRSFIAVGNIVYADDHGGYSEPFSGTIRWKSKDDDAGTKGWEGWVWDSNGLAVADQLEEQVIVHFWSDVPSSEKKGAV